MKPSGTPVPKPSAPKIREPYQALFVVGVSYALLGAGLWPWSAWGRLPYPGPLHAILMIEGFELAFISGFLLTIVSRLTRTDTADRPELPWVIVALLLFGVAAAIGQVAVAHGAALVTLLLLAFAIARRVARRQNDPPEEFVFVPLGLALGLAGAAVQLAAAAGWLVEPAPRFGLHLMSLGMVMSFVLGFGGLLVPTFIGSKDPLVIPRIARAHERPARRILYGGLGGAIALSFVADALGWRWAGAWMRVVAASFMLGWVWKLWRLPRRRTVPAFVLWTSGWLVGLGLWAAALSPVHEIAAWHITLLGGYGALTMGIASRVVVTHGGRGVNEESRVLNLGRAALLALALALRLGAESAGPNMMWWLAASAIAWILAWSGWLLAAQPHLRGS